MRMIDNEIILMTMLNFNNDDGKLNKMKQTKKKKKMLQIPSNKISRFSAGNWMDMCRGRCVFLSLVIIVFFSFNRTLKI